MSDISKIVKAEDKEILNSAGIDFSENSRSGSFLQEDDQVVVSKSLYPGVDILNTDQALKTIPEAKSYFGQAFRKLGKSFPEDTKGGYFIRVRKGVEVALPIQSCLFLKKNKFNQRVHNIIIIEEGAKLYLITGCAAAKAAEESFHLGVSEFFVQKNGYLNFTMVHSWKEDARVKPISIALVDQGAVFISNYICLKPVKEITMYPTALLEGENARASFNSLILSFPNTEQDIGSRVIFNAPGSQGEIISRAVTLGGKIVARGHLLAKTADVKAHLECRGLLVSAQGIIHAIPELETEYRDVDLSHEAAIGRIRKEEIEYLCSRGMSKEEAQSVIIRGFINTDILALPEMLRKEMKKLEDMMLKATL